MGFGFSSDQVEHVTPSTHPPDETFFWVQLYPFLFRSFPYECALTVLWLVSAQTPGARMKRFRFDAFFTEIVIFRE